MPEYLEKLLDGLDASVFSGDAFVDDDNREKFRMFMNRWERELLTFDKLSKEIMENE